MATAYISEFRTLN